MTKNIYFRLTLTIAYFLIAIFVAVKVNNLPVPLGSFARNCVITAVEVVLFIAYIELVRYPLGKKKFDIAVRKIGLHNSLLEYPTLISVKNDRNKRHGIIFTIKNNGISIIDFDSKTAALETALNIRISAIDFGKTTKTTKIFAVPFKYAKPTVMTTDSTDLIKNMINLLVVGRTGSGKSYALLTILGIYTKIPDIRIIICDYKKSSFSQFEESKNFFGYNDVGEGIKAVYQEFSERLQDNNQERNKNKIVLLIDEYGAFISSQDKKNAEQFKTLIGNMLFMGRSLGIIVILGTQRANSELFANGARDQFSAVLALGNLSKEQKSMLFFEEREKLNRNNGLGEGYLLIDGKGVEPVKIAPITDFDTLNKNITAAMNR